MKSKLLKYSLIALMSVSGIFGISCSEDEKDTSKDVKIQSVTPTIVVKGDKLDIVGANFSRVKSIVLPGNIEITNFTLVGEFQISVTIPEGISNGNVVLKTDQGNIVSPVEIKLENPSVKLCMPGAPDTVDTGGKLAILGTDLGRVKKIVFSNNIEIEALDFVRKTEQEIIVIVPPGTTDWENTVDLVTASGKVLTTPKIIIRKGSEVEPITPASIVLFDFEDGSFPGLLWGPGSIASEKGNHYYQGDGVIGGFSWFFVNNVVLADKPPLANKVLKFDMKVTADFPAPANSYKIQWVMGGNWGWCTSNHFPLKEDGITCSTNGKWKTITLEFSTIGITAIGATDSFGLACSGSAFDWGVICIDNVRIDPK